MNSIPNQLNPAMEVELAGDVGLMGLNGLRGDKELFGNLSVGITEGHQWEDFFFPLGEDAISL